MDMTKPKLSGTIRPNTKCQQHSGQTGVRGGDGERGRLVPPHVHAHHGGRDLAVAHARPAPGPAGPRSRLRAYQYDSASSARPRYHSRSRRSVRHVEHDQLGIGRGEREAEQVERRDVAAVEAAGDGRGVVQDVLTEEHQPERGQPEVDAAQPAGDRAEQRARRRRRATTAPTAASGVGQPDAADLPVTGRRPGTRSRRRPPRRRRRGPSES